MNSLTRLHRALRAPKFCAIPAAKLVRVRFRNKHGAQTRYGTSWSDLEARLRRAGEIQ